ncbi:GNAT family N-acetyltransferase [Spirosoma taeanense]|uniref:GNAT family N-acetyltransferase n=1 Tax=Spirosoma taeanense TaxID=2735870 RepID=A0A6M5Y890_9BACT|nr:GNAT family N-acetyltransferase [Spirosoma taeanense]QJW89481.1 GNAT family N-acetyltransferase [Spirosoma taeanense]
MLSLNRTTPFDDRFLTLVAELNADLRSRYGAQQAQFDPHNTLPADARAIVALDGETPVGCGCYKVLDEADQVEVKRMYVRPDWRRMGVAAQILTELEAWAREDGYSFARLELADKQPEAMVLYQKSGYKRIANYGPYVNIAESICMEKAISPYR